MPWPVASTVRRRSFRKRRRRPGGGDRESRRFDERRRVFRANSKFRFAIPGTDFATRRPVRNPKEKTVQTLSVVDLKAFVPAKDHELAQRFYTDLGFKRNWGNEQVAEMEIGSFRFLLQNFYAPQYVENFMMQLMVDDADQWWRHIEDSRLPAKYPGTTAKPPTMQPWGLRVLYLTDPSGVLWHIADRRGG
jgi:uncharacterized glyoxalase superfamily protein PhnB